MLRFLGPEFNPGVLPYERLVCLSENLNNTLKRDRFWAWLKIYLIPKREIFKME